MGRKCGYLCVAGGQALWVWWIAVMYRVGVVVEG